MLGLVPLQEETGRETTSPCENEARRCPPTNKEEGPHQELNQPGP